MPPPPPLLGSHWLVWTSYGLRDWSLITRRGGGATKREGGAHEVLPLERGGGAEKVLAVLKGGGGTKSFGVVFYVVA